MDIILFALVALFLIWKLKGVLNGEQSFLSQNTQKKTPSDSIKKVHVISVKDKKPEPDNFFEEQKELLPENLHESYRVLLNVYPNITVDGLKSIIVDAYEELMLSLENKDPSLLPSFVSGDLCKKLTKNIQNIQYSIHLSEVKSVEIKLLEIKGKAAKILADVSSKQLIYKMDKDGNVTEGSKITPVSILESVEMVRTTNQWIVTSIASV